MAETKVAMMLEKETEGIVNISKKLIDCIKYQLDSGLENVDTKELGEAVDMVKDLYEAKEKIVKACYYKQIMEAMEEAGEEEPVGEEEGRMYYRGQPRDSMGRFRSRRGRRGYEEPMGFEMTPEMYRQHDPEYWRDMDREHGKMYYSGGGSGSSGGSSRGSMSGGSMGGGARNYGGESGRDYREGRSGERRKSYMETKEMNSGNSPEEKQRKMKELEGYAKELTEDITNMISDASSEEKSMLKSKLQTLVQKIQ